MIKNKEILAIIEAKKTRIDCENCKYCHLGAYHSGKWYCQHQNVSVMNPPTDITKCFEKK